MHHDHDDEHDLGLHHDLATLLRRSAAPPRLERRDALKVLAGAGAGLVLTACGSDAKKALSSSTTTTSAAGATSTTVAGTTSTTAGSTGSPAAAIPEETAGPYPGDGTNGPNVLTESGIVRRDIRSSFGSLSGTAEGEPVTVDLTLVTASTGQPLAGAALYIWHCSREAGYSLYSPGVTDQNYLRGVQESDADGRLSFTTIFPACYDGRWPHMHFEVYPSLDEATSAGSRLVTSQLALPRDTCEAVYATTGYEASPANLARVSLDSDMVFRDGYASQLATIGGDVGAGLTAGLVVAV